MTTPQRGIGKFTVQNLVAIIRAVPKSNGTYADVAKLTTERNGDVPAHTIANWVQAGNADIREGNNATAYARLAKIYTDLLEENCGAEANRTYELERALEILELTCECGNEKMVQEDGKVADQCQICRELDEATRMPRRAPEPAAATAGA